MPYKRKRVISFAEKCKNALELSGRASDDKIFRAIADIEFNNFCWQGKIVKYEILIPLIVISLLLLVPQIINGGTNVVKWLPQIQIVIDSTPTLFIILCCTILINALFKCYNRCKLLNKIHAHLEYIKMPESKQERQKYKERMFGFLMPMIPGILGIVLTTTITTIGMIIKADPAWIPYASITIASSSFIGTITVRKKRTNSYNNNEPRINEKKLERSLLQRKLGHLQVKVNRMSVAIIGYKYRIMYNGKG